MCIICAHARRACSVQNAWRIGVVESGRVAGLVLVGREGRPHPHATCI